MMPQADSNDRDSIDFLLIGAQKSGTTSLWNHIAAHPAIFVPATKEVEFFSDPQRFGRGLDWYRQTFFGGAPAGARKGEATTQYMMFPEVPQRIHAAFPDVRLIALLRNPIDRAHSHHRMTVMRGHEARGFEDCIEALQAAAGDETRPIDLNHDYLRLGEYGRILDRYLEWFDRKQLLVLFTENLEAEPRSVCQHVYEFLEVDSGFHPPHIDKRFNVGGDAALPTLGELMRRTVGRARRLPGVGRLISQDRYEAFKFWTRTELQVRVTPRDGVDVGMRARLARHFAPDVERLREKLGVDPPWPEFAAGNTKD